MKDYWQGRTAIRDLSLGLSIEAKLHRVFGSGAQLKEVGFNGGLQFR